MGLDAALTKLGSLGRFQILVYVIISLTLGITTSWQLFAIVFIGVFHPHHCRAQPNMTLEESVPLEEVDGELVWSQCEMYGRPGQDNTTVACATGWQYDPLDFHPDSGTITMEWDLVCSRDGLVELSQTIFSVGICFGAFVFTPCADYFGRRIVFFMSLFFMHVFGLAMAFSPNYAAFCCFQFFTGACGQGMILPGFVIASELFPAKKRTIMSQSCYLFTAVGTVTLPLLAFAIRDWRMLQLVISVPGFVVLLFFPWCPESLFWLESKGRKDDLMKTLRRAAKFNKVVLPENVLDLQDDHDLQSAKVVDPSIKPRIIDMLKNSRTRRYMFIMLYLVLVNDLMFFGISLMTASMEGNRYLVFAINSILEVPGYVIGIILSNMYGRRRPLLFFHMFAGVFMSFAAVASVYQIGPLSQGLTVTILTLVAKFGVAGCWSIELIYSLEIYPTLIRGTGMGISAGVGYLGSVLAPFTAFLFRKHTWIVGALFAVLSTTAGFLALFCPETTGRPLPTTVAEVASWPLTLTKQEWNQIRVHKKGQKNEEKTTMNECDLSAISNTMFGPSNDTFDENRYQYTTVGEITKF